MQSLIPLFFIGLFLYLMFFERVESAAAVVLQTWREKKKHKSSKRPSQILLSKVIELDKDE